MTAKEQVALIDQFEKHKSWLESDGMSGTRIVLDGIDLRDLDLSLRPLKRVILRNCALTNNLVGLDFSGAILEGCDFNSSDCRRAIFDETSLYGSKFWYADCSHASFRDATDIVPCAFKGANLYGAILPETVTFPGTERVGRLANESTTLFLAQLGAAAYCALTTGATTDAALTLNTGTTTLPIIQTAVPLTSFFWVAPILLLCLFTYFQLNLQSLWEEIAQLPNVLPDGSLRSHTGRPWLTTPFLNDEGEAQTLTLTPAFKGTRAALTLLCGWVVTPLILGMLWVRYLPKHDWIGTRIHIICLGLITSLAVLFIAVGRKTLAKKNNPKIARFADIWQPAMAILIALLLVAVCFSISRTAFRGLYRRHWDQFSQGPRYENGEGPRNLPKSKWVTLFDPSQTLICGMLSYLGDQARRPQT